MKTLILAMLNVAIIDAVSCAAIAGSLDSTAAPSSGSGMYSLSQIYDYLNSGTAATVPGIFQEPSTAPGSTMKTTKEIYDDIKSKFDECPATTANVESGVKFFCTQPGNWGVQTGAAQLVPTPTPTPTVTGTPTITPIPTATPWCAAKGGYWAPDGLGGYGCWFKGATDLACSTVCGNVGLSCDSRGWNDSSSCDVCRHWGPGYNCTSAGIGWKPPYIHPQSSTCYYANSPGVTPCSEAGADGGSRLCVCTQ
jgi:hypothetical protein